MTSLADVYEGGVGGVQTRRRLYVGVGLLAVGTVLGLVAMVVATTQLAGGPDSFAARRLAGVVGGVAAPAILGGVATVLPASRRLRVAAAVGASLALAGVAMFWHAYPGDWAGYGDQLTPYVTGVYFLGMLTLACCLFAGIATFKRRNDPGGTVSMELVTDVETRIVEVEHPSFGLGGVGFFGGTPDGEVDTQTNRPDAEETADDGAAGAGEETGGAAVLDDGTGGGAATSAAGTDVTASAGAHVSDGGGADAEIRTPGVDGPTTRKPQLADRYCGNCTSFRYVRTQDGMRPYCEADGEYMDDMEACESWHPNADRSRE